MKEDMKTETRRGHMKTETRRGPLAEVHTVECIKRTVEDLAAETDPAAQEDMIDMKMIEKVIEGGQKRPVDMQVEDMKQKTEGEMMIGREQEAQLPEEGNTEKIAPTMNMKVKEEEAEEVIHQRQDIEEETPAIINEGDAQGP